MLLASLQMIPPLRKFTQVPGISLLERIGCTNFHIVTINLQKLPKFKVRTYLKVIIKQSLCEVQRFLSFSITRYGSDRNFAFMTMTLNLQK